MAPIGRNIPLGIVREHIARLCGLMPAEMAAVLVFDPANMLAFTGTPHASWDRLTCGFVTRDGQAHLVCPRFERPAVSGAAAIATIHTWNEEENPYERLAAALRTAGVKSGKLGLDGRTWIEAARSIESACSFLSVESAEPLLREVRICKSPAEQELLRAAHRRAEAVYFELQRIIAAGQSEIALQQQLEATFEPRGLRLGIMIQSGPNGAIPHNPTGARKLQAGDLVVVDDVVVVDGYNNDLTRTFAVGAPGDKARRAYRAVREAHDAAIAAARPGIECRELDRLARSIIERAGFGEFFIHRLGHGLGIECHEPPYLNGANSERLRAGMCVTIEPGIYVPDEFGVRIEDDVLITNDGCEVLSGELKTDVSAELVG